MRLWLASVLVADLPGLLEYMGVENVREMGDEIYGLCPMHIARVGYQQNRPHWSMNKRTGLHSCFSCGWKGNLLTFVMQLQHCSWERARRIVKKYGVDSALNTEWTVEPVIEEFSLDVQLRMFERPSTALLNERQISAESADRFGVRWSSDFDGWVLPIRSPGPYGKLIGWQLKAGHKVRNFPRGIKKSATVFGAEYLEDFDGAPAGHAAVLVESPLDAVYLYGCGLKASFASFGAAVSDAQMSLLVEHYDCVVLALDNDKAGLAAIDWLVPRWIGRTRLEVIGYAPDSPKDVGEMTSDQVLTAIGSSISGWQWMEQREGAQTKAKGTAGAVQVSARCGRSNGRAQEAPRSNGDGARQDGGHNRRRRASHRSR